MLWVSEGPSIVCQAIPRRLLEVDGITGRIDRDGVSSEVNLTQVPGVARGDYVIVYAGMALERVSAEDAAMLLEFYAAVAGVVE